MTQTDNTGYVIWKRENAEDFYENTLYRMRDTGVTVEALDYICKSAFQAGLQSSSVTSVTPSLTEEESPAEFLAGLALSTVHVPKFEGHPATITVTPESPPNVVCECEHCGMNVEHAYTELNDYEHEITAGGWSCLACDTFVEDESANFYVSRPNRWVK